MNRRTATSTSPANAPYPACGGPATHIGLCVDREGYVLPVYAELAEVWEEQGRPPMSAEEVDDFLEMYQRIEVQPT